MSKPIEKIKSKIGAMDAQLVPLIILYIIGVIVTTCIALYLTVLKPIIQQNEMDVPPMKSVSKAEMNQIILNWIDEYKLP